MNNVVVLVPEADARLYALVAHVVVVLRVFNVTLRKKLLLQLIDHGQQYPEIVKSLSDISETVESA